MPFTPLTLSGGEGGESAGYSLDEKLALAGEGAVGTSDTGATLDGIEVKYGRPNVDAILEGGIGLVSALTSMGGGKVVVHGMSFLALASSPIEVLVRMADDKNSIRPRRTHFFHSMRLDGSEDRWGWECRR
jgi:hypothetical protein